MPQEALKADLPILIPIEIMGNVATDFWIDVTPIIKSTYVLPHLGLQSSVLFCLGNVQIIKLLLPGLMIT